MLGRNEEDLSRHAQDIQARKAYDVETVVGDLQELGFRTEFLARIKREELIFFRVLIAFGALGQQAVLEQDPQAAVQLIELNFNAKVQWLLALKPHLGRGSTVHVISSVAGDRGRKSNYIYGSAYAGLSAFVEGLSSAWLNDGIYVQLVKPGFVDTPMTASVKKGPLFVAPIVIAKDMWRSSKTQQPMLYTPWFWRYIMFGLCLLPVRLFRKLKI
jgi:short-subunit dehydrogenase